MIILDNFVEAETIGMKEMSYARFFTSYVFWPGVLSKNEFFRCGELKPKGNKFAYPEEEQCANHICRKVGNGIYQIHVIRDDGTVWTIDLRAFKTITPLNVFMEG